jgi:Holliday junction resolvase RusA-like endonuclease
MRFIGRGSRWLVSDWIIFSVIGKPATKGSWRIRRKRGKAWLSPDNERERPWADVIAWAAKEKMRGSALLEGPLDVAILFEFQKPKKPARPYPTGDVDKLARSALDALTGVLWVDDVQVTRLSVTKRYGAKEPGASFVIKAAEGYK